MLPNLVVIWLVQILSWPSFEVLARGWSVSLLEQPTNFTPQPPLYGALTILGCYSPLLVTPGPGTRQRGPASRLLVSAFKQTTPGLLFMTPVPSQGNDDNGSGPQFPFFLFLWLALELSWVVPHGALCSPQGTLPWVYPAVRLFPNFSLLMCIWPHHVLPRLIWLKY